MKYSIKDNVITLHPTPKRKVKSGIRVFYTRNLDEAELSDLPVATADIPKDGRLDWLEENFIIHTVMIKKRWFFKHSWEEIKRVDN